MQFLRTDLPGVVVIQPDVHQDARGFFVETFHSEKYRRGGIDALFVQDNHSSSVRGTLRGLHMQLRKPQGKLIRVIQGEIWDVAVDVRPGSDTFRRWVAASLSAENYRQLYIPPGFAHGFCVMTDRAQVEYKCTAHYDPADEIGIAYNDPEIAIAWPVHDPLLSERDKRNPPLKELLERIEGAQPSLPVRSDGYSR